MKDVVLYIFHMIGFYLRNETIVMAETLQHCKKKNVVQGNTFESLIIFVRLLTFIAVIPIENVCEITMPKKF